jgi:hypothetical protein
MLPEKWEWEADSPPKRKTWGVLLATMIHYNYRLFFSV